MSVKPPFFNRSRSVTAALALSVFGLVSCTDSEAGKKRLLETGNKYYDSGKYKEASIIYRKVLQKDQRYGEAHYRLGLSELKQGRYGDAIRWLRRASELQPENGDAHAKLGDLYLTIYLADRSKYKQLLVDLQELEERLLKSDPRSFEGLRMKGYLAVANENWKEAVAAFQQANDVRPGQPHVQLALAQAMVADKQSEAAEALVRSSLEKNKTYGPLYDFLYAAALSRKDIPGAEAIARQKVENNPDSGQFYLELANHYYRAKDEKKVAETLARMTSNPKKFPDAFRQAGDFYFRAQRFDLAMNAYEEGVKAQPDQKAVYQKKQVELLSLQNKLTEATTLAQKVAEENPDDAEAKAIRASLRLRTLDPKELDQAIAEFRSVLSKMQDNPVLRFNLGEALLAKGDVDGARNEFTESIKLRAAYIPPKLALGRIHLSKQEFARAQQLSEQILKTSPNFLPARLMRASALMGLQDVKAARTELALILERLPNLPDARYLMGMLDLSERQYAPAEAAFKALLEKKDPRGLMGLVEVYSQTNRLDQARQLLQAELKGTPANAQRVKLALADLAAKSQKYDEAITGYQQLIDQNPKNAALYIKMGDTLYVSKRYAEAGNAFSKAQELAPNEIAPIIRLAMTYEINGKRDSTEPLYKKILTLDPNNFVALNNLAYLMVTQNGDTDMALTYVQKAKQYAPNNPDIDDTLGLIYLKKNQHDNAIRIFKELLNKNPSHVTWRIHMADALFNKGDKLQAKKELEEAARNGPSAEEKNLIDKLKSRIG
jgi:tetratricopeptide (TPR) repeat protein